MGIGIVVKRLRLRRSEQEGSHQHASGGVVGLRLIKGQISRSGPQVAECVSPGSLYELGELVRTTREPVRWGARRSDRDVTLCDVALLAKVLCETSRRIWQENFVANKQYSIGSREPGARVPRMGKESRPF